MTEKAERQALNTARLSRPCKASACDPITGSREATEQRVGTLNTTEAGGSADGGQAASAPGRDRRDEAVGQHGARLHVCVRTRASALTTACRRGRLMSVTDEVNLHFLSCFVLFCFARQ